MTRLKTEEQSSVSIIPTHHHHLHPHRRHHHSARPSASRRSDVSAEHQSCCCVQGVRAQMGTSLSVIRPSGSDIKVPPRMETPARTRDEDEHWGQDEEAAVRRRRASRLNYSREVRGQTHQTWGRLSCGLAIKDPTVMCLCKICKPVTKAGTRYMQWSEKPSIQLTWVNVLCAGGSCCFPWSCKSEVESAKLGRQNGRFFPWTRVSKTVVTALPILK